MYSIYAAGNIRNPDLTIWGGATIIGCGERVTPTPERGIATT